MNATERFKALFANYVERVCVLESELEQTRAQLAELRAAEPDAPEQAGSPAKAANG